MTTLVIAPHADDEVLGVGGTIARLAAEGEQVVVAVITGHGEGPHPISSPESLIVVRQECKQACHVLGVDQLIFKDLPAVLLDTIPVWQVNKVVLELIEEISPDTIFIPFAQDLHKDHGVIAYAVSVATRSYLPVGKSISKILAYETLSETHLAPPYLEASFQPNYFVDITKYVDLKLEAMSQYVSQLQASPLPRSLNTIRALSLLRGSHIGVEAAESFVLLREVV